MHNIDCCVQHKSDFDPFADLFLAQETKPSDLETLDISTLTPFQRALLAADGTVTKLIEAYALEPVDVILLKQAEHTLSQAQVWLETPAHSSVIAREVLLRGRITATPYVYATSLLMPQRLTADIRRGLKVESGGLGRILLNSHIENRRELLWYGRKVLNSTLPELKQLRNCAVISRTYQIIVSDQPAMLITEHFPHNADSPP